MSKETALGTHERNMECLTSIVLPVHDGAATLGAAIESIRRQSHGHWELLVVDDGSSDDSPDIASAHAEADPRVRLLPAGRVGLVRALRYGCDAARGAYIARMDADDVSMPDRLERQLALMRGDDAIALCGTHVTDITPGDGRRRYTRWLNSLRTHEDIIRNILIECPLAHPTFVMRREALESVGGYRDNGWPEDYDLVLRLWAAGRRLAVVGGDPLLGWRDSPTRLSRTDPRYSLESFRACKMHHLLHSPLLPSERRLWQWGGGQEGKAWLRAWPSGRMPELVVEVSPRRIGKRLHGVPVIAPAQLPAPDGALLVVVVGARGARDLIRPFLLDRGWREGEDFLFAA